MSEKPLPLDQVVNPFAVENPPEEVPQSPEPASAASETPPEPEKALETPPTGEKPPSRSQLTEKLDAANAVIEKMKADGETTDQKYRDAIARQQELEAQVKERDESFVKSRTPVYKWEEDEQVTSIRKEIGGTIRTTAADLTEENAGTFKSDLPHLISAYEKAWENGDGMLRALRSKWVDIFGEDDGVKVFKAVQEIYPKHTTSVELQKKNESSYLGKVQQGYETRRRTFTEKFTKIGRASKEEIEANPNDVNSIISAAIGGDEEFLKSVELMARRAADATAGLPPLEPGATPEAVAKYRTAERNLEAFRETAFESDVKLRILVPLVKKLYDENAALKKRVTTAADANRPESAAQTPSQQRQGGTEIPKTGDFGEIVNPYAK